MLVVERYIHISTHALLAEGDDRAGLTLASLVKIFQPTPSLRRATGHIWSPEVCSLISTHALLAEGDVTGRRGLYARA